MCYYNSRQLGLSQFTITCYYNLRQLGYSNSGRLLLQFTTGSSIHDDCYYNLRQVLQFSTLLQFTTEHTAPNICQYNEALVYNLLINKITFFLFPFVYNKFMLEHFFSKLTFDPHTNTHCIFCRDCLLVKMASKTVILRHILHVTTGHISGHDGGLFWTLQHPKHRQRRYGGRGYSLGSKLIKRHASSILSNRGKYQG